VDEWVGLPESVWVSAGDGAVSWDRPTDGRTTSFNTAMSQGAEWTRRAKRLKNPQLGRQASIDEVDSPPRRQAEPERFTISTPHYSSTEDVEQPSASDRVPEAGRPAVEHAVAVGLMPPGATPDHSLPKRIVTKFTAGTALWWMMAGGIHCARMLIRFSKTPAYLEAEAFDRLGTWQPGQAAFFEVSSLNCNSTHMLLSDRFAHYAAERLPGTGGFGTLAELGEAGVASELAWLRGTGMASASSPPPVRMPASWRTVATAWEPCAARANSSCDKAWLAGWDGTSVAVATAHLDAPSGAWRVRPQFRVHPGLGRHSGTSHANRSLAAYTDVRALHLSPGGRTLAVLLGSRELDLWDLSAGSRLGRWALSHDYAALCRDGAELLLARQDDDGPVLELMRLPWASVPRAREDAERQSHAGRRNFLEAAPRPGAKGPLLVEV